MVRKVGYIMNRMIQLRKVAPSLGYVTVKG